MREVFYSAKPRNSRDRRDGFKSYLKHFLCDLRQVNSLLRASVSSSVK